MERIKNEWALLDDNRKHFITLSSIPGFIIYYESKRKLKIEGYSKEVAGRVEKSLLSFIENKDPTTKDFKLKLDD